MAQQNRRSGQCPRCKKYTMRSGQQASTHGKVNGVQVCDDCVVDNLMGDLLNKAIERRD